MSSKQLRASATRLFFYKKKLYEKMRLKWSKSKENLKKTTRLNFQNLVFLLAKNRYFVVIAFKVLKMELKFKYTILITIVQPILASLFQLKLRKI